MSTSSHVPADPGRVDLTSAAELRYWCREFGCDEQALRDAVAAVGEHVTALRERLCPPPRR